MKQELAQLTDSELVDRCRRHDDAAFNVLYNRYRLQLFSYLHKLLPGNRSLVDDIFQQVWMKALSYWDRYNDQQRFLAWLCRIGHNLVMDHYRSEARGEKVELTDNLPSEYVGAGERIDREILEKALGNALADLSPEQREVVELRQKGVSFKEIAEIQNSNLNTVLGRMHYAVNKLKVLLRDYL
ncbi:MAG: sigma-70 family RNA polymerase sigma factor [Victivallales bacterium]|nr:sigma-70 family RNA polymerase sigma factor [Victivallales bacterium]